MSSDSRCYSFDDRGNGYAKGEGFGVLVLKPLVDAVAAGDTIRAVIRSTSTNQDGRTPGMTQPSEAAQEAQIREAYRVAGLDLHSTRLFEAHGTGTAVGDPIEARAIKSVFQNYRSREDPMYVSAVKSNIGHLEATAGIAGVIKVIICLEKGIIPPNAGFQSLNPQINAEEWNLRFLKEAIPWPTVGLRRASVNSFGYGGSNAHAVLDDAFNYLRERHLTANHCTVEKPPTNALDTTSDATTDDIKDEPHISGNGVTPKSRIEGDQTATNGSIQHGSQQLQCNPHNGVGTNEALTDRPYLLVWSGSEATAIERISSTFKTLLSRQSATSNQAQYLKDLAFTLSNKRSILPWKTFLLVSSMDDLRAKLDEMPKPIRSSTAPKLCFIFTGQGAQWARMGMELFRFQVFQDSLLGAESYLKSLGSKWSLLDELEKAAGSSSIDSPSLAQPICTALQIAIIDLLNSWKVQPWAVAGHSSGEIAAAFAAGAISRQSAWTIAYFRGELAARLATLDHKERGAMLAVQIAHEDLQQYFEYLAEIGQQGTVSIGCENSPGNYTLTGLQSVIQFLRNKFEDDGIFCRQLNIPVAYHSPYMETIADEYLSLLQSIAPPDTPNLDGHQAIFVSSVTGDVLTLKQLSQPSYWIKNLVSRVRFSEAIQRLSSIIPNVPSRSQGAFYIEIGPHAALQRPIKDTLTDQNGVLYDSVLKRNVSSLLSAIQLAGRLFVEGHMLDIDQLNRCRVTDDPPKMLTDLPQYPFNHSQRYWLESRMFRNYRQRDRLRHELLGLPSTDWSPLKPRWRHTLRMSDLPWLKDHQVYSTHHSNSSPH
jgi:acyl transferase domain-containing protein